MHSTLEKSTFLILLLAMSVAFTWILSPFFSPIFWAFVLALLFYPMNRMLVIRTGNKKNIAALTTLVIATLMAVLPTMVLAGAVFRELGTIYSEVTQDGEDIEGYIDKVQESYPAIRNFFTELGMDVESVKESARAGISQAGEFLAKYTFTFGQNAVLFIINLALMLYLTFFLLRDGKIIVMTLLRAFPLHEERERLLVEKFSEVVRATIKGNVIIALIQGSLGGLAFWALGIPGPLLWGAVMVVVSLIPLIGSGLVWVPVGIYLFVTGNWIKGIVLLLFGTFVIGLVDNFLRPILVGRDTKLPDYIVLFSTLGGLALLGIDGFVMGPLIAASFVVLWQIFVQEFNTDGRV